MADHTSAHSLAIFELVVYIAIAPIELYVLIRHGFRNLLSWITLNSVVMLQLIGAAIVLSQGSTNTSSTGTILAQVGLTPLILSVQAILHQMWVKDFVLASILLLMFAHHLASGPDTHPSAIFCPSNGKGQSLSTLL